MRYTPNTLALSANTPAAAAFLYIYIYTNWLGSYEIGTPVRAAHFWPGWNYLTSGDLCAHGRLAYSRNFCILHVISWYCFTPYSHTHTTLLLRASCCCWHNLIYLSANFSSAWATKFIFMCGSCTKPEFRPKRETLGWPGTTFIFLPQNQSQISVCFYMLTSCRFIYFKCQVKRKNPV